MNILVTGGAGFIGSNLVEELVKEHSIIVLDNFHTGSYQNLENVKNQITIINCSCDNIFRLDTLNTDIDIIFHFGIPSSSPMYKENPLLIGEAINGTVSIFEFAKKHKIEKVIYASSSSLYNGIIPPHREDMNIRVTDYYTEARLTIERIAKLYNILHGIRSIGLRFFSVYGPGEKYKGQYANIITQFLWDMKKDKSPIIYGDGKQERDFTYVKDIVYTCILLIDRLNLDSGINHSIFNVGTGTSKSFNNIIEILNYKLGTDIRPIHIKMPIKNYVDKTLADITEIKRLGYIPKYSVEQGIDELILNY